MWRRRERIRAQCATMKKNTPMSQKLYVLQVMIPCDLLSALYREPLSPEAWCGARSTRRPPPTGATTSSTWRAEHSRRWSRSLPATHSKATEIYSGFALIGRAPTLLCSHWSRSGQSITLYVLSFCMRPNTATSYSFAFAFASTTLSIIVKCMQFTQVLGCTGPSRASFTLVVRQ